MDDTDIEAWASARTVTRGQAEEGGEVSDDAATVLARVRALADQWNDTPDYTPSTYDQGRVDQRHDMTMQLLEVLGDE